MAAIAKIGLADRLTGSIVSGTPARVYPLSVGEVNPNHALLSGRHLYRLPRLHISAVERVGLSGLNEGQVIEYEEASNKGKTSAENLRVKR